MTSSWKAVDPVSSSLQTVLQFAGYYLGFESGEKHFAADQNRGHRERRSGEPTRQARTDPTARVNSLACKTLTLSSHHKRFLFATLFWLALSGIAIALPSFQEVKGSWVGSESVLLDRHREPIGELRTTNDGRRLHWAPLSHISPALIQALIAAEDRRFYKHGGVDWRSVAGALIKGLTSEELRGASTITMQLAALLQRDLTPRGGRRSLLQKGKQILAALLLERHWSKEEILEAYLNLVSFRGELQGISAASRALFGKEPHGLTQTESLILASLIRSPNAPFEAIKTRALSIASSLGWAQLEKQIDENLRNLFLGGYLLGSRVGIAPHVATILLKDQPKGSRVVSSLDASVQHYVVERLEHHLELLRGQNMNEGAALVVENQSGEVLAYVSLSRGRSRRSYVDGVRARRQVGSALKPFLYAQALDEGILTPASLLNDSPVDIRVLGGVYSPKNYDGLHRGPVSVRMALASSLNIPAVRALLLIGEEAYLSKLQALGFSNIRESGEFFGPSLALGTLDVSLWDLVNAYRALANGGIHGGLTLVPSMGHSVSYKRVFSEGAAFQISQILSDREARGVTFGLENPLSTRFWSAVKTGTSKDMRDNWCVGYSSRYTVGVWVGNFSGEPMWNVSGVSGAAPVWGEIMNFLHKDTPSEPPTPPASLVRKEIWFPQGLEPSRQEWFVKGTEPPFGMVALNEGATHLIYPPSGAIMAVDPDIPPEEQVVLFLAEGFQKDLIWNLNGTPLAGTSGLLRWPVKEGTHSVAILNQEGKKLDQVSFTVRGPGTWREHRIDHWEASMESPSP